MRNLWSRIRRLPARRMRYLVEAAALLAISRIALAALPFRYVSWFLDKPLLRQSGDPSQRDEQRRNVTWAIARGCRYLPGETVCFPRAIAAHVMCRMRGIDSTLYYGAAVLPNSGLRAHVWLQDGATGVVGNRVADGYYVLAQYPAKS